ncbi:hypothetical protein BKA70DRAFT_1434003 [Coprinopsis sp. MPI-PUGE-AT-0042]|nr:hypothetical protein BKA70DRAFT_1434003 [Coprinopsis sp. MPI-PUGE-AT-0042]
MSPSATIQHLLIESASGGIRWDQGRELLISLKSLPSLSLAVDGTSISIISNSPPSSPNEDMPSDDCPSMPYTQGFEQFTDYSQVSMRLGASIIDRTNCLDLVIKHFQNLKTAIDDYNEANINATSASATYSAFEKYYSSQSPSIPKAMNRLREAMLAQLTASPSFSRS